MPKCLVDYAWRLERRSSSQSHNPSMPSPVVDETENWGADEFSSVHSSQNR